MSAQAAAFIGLQKPYLAIEFQGTGGTPPRSYSDVPEAGAQVLSLSVFTVAAQVIAFVADRPALRHIFTCEGNNFDRGFFFRFDTLGRLTMFYRTPSAQVAMTTVAAFDDGVWHNVAVVRDPSGTPTFRMYIDGVEVLTDTTDPGTTTGQMDSARGNWNPGGTGPNPDEPAVNCRIATSYVIAEAMTTTEVDALLNRDATSGFTVLNVLGFPDANNFRITPEIGP